MKRPIRTIINDLIQIASELEEFETSLNQFLGISDPLISNAIQAAQTLQARDVSKQRGETTKSDPFQSPLIEGSQNQKRTWSKHPKAELTKVEKDQIRLLYKQGQHTIDQLVELYNSNRQQINGILKNNTLKAVEAARAIKERRQTLN